jgi:hypothetical protein
VEHQVDMPGREVGLVDVVLDEGQALAFEVRDVGPGAGQQVVDADHLVAAADQRFAEVGPDESRPAGDNSLQFLPIPRYTKPRSRMRWGS